MSDNAVEEITLAGSAAPTRFAGADSSDVDRAFVPQAASEDVDDDLTVIHEPTAKQPEALSPEEKEERRQLLRKIGRYRSLFPKELDDISTTVTGLQTMSMEKLRDLATDVEFLVGTRRSAKAVRGMFIAGLQAGELAGPLVGLELQGLASVAASSEDLLLTVDEVAVKYEKILYVDPVARLGLAVVQLALAVDSHNRRAKTAVPPPTPAAVVPVATPQAAYDGPPPRGVAPTTPMNLEGSTLAPEKAAGAAATRLDNIATAADYQDL